MEKETYFCGTGRRKCAIAQVKLLPGEGAIMVNDIPYEEVFPRVVDRGHILKPLTVTETLNKYRVVVKATGGGTTGQSEAISHGISRALVQADEKHKAVLRQNGLLTRDARVKERKKPGLVRARKAAQSPKR